MDLKVYIAQLEKQARELKTTKAILIAASTAHADMVERIFTDGIASNGSKIGSYDTRNEQYVNPENSPKKFQPKGKGEKKSKTTQVFDISTQKSRRVAIKKDFSERKTRYFESYKAFRAMIGRETAYVNLDLFGRLKQEFENSLRRVSNEDFEARLRTEESIEKATGNQRRFGKAIFSATESERETFLKTLIFEMRKIYA